MRLGRLLPLLAGLAASPAAAQAVATSPGPEAVSVTVYRDPDRWPGKAFDLGWLRGYALVTERRTIDLPPGEAEIRFEGVAGGIQPESAIVTGLPDGVAEKNRDAWLLSPGSLLDASLGRRVRVRRTSLADGAVSETDAVIRSGADGAVVLETPAGIEALRCTGIPETLIYGEVPAGLSARPTLSVRTRSAAATRATVTLSYLATGFDWQADYIAELSEDGKRMDLFAWLTLANGDETSFVGARAQAVAGKLEREPGDEGEADSPPITLQCWPQGNTTSDLPVYLPPPPAEPPSLELRVSPAAPEAMLMSVSPVTTVASQEALGDLKLYRIPEPVTVAAKSQKQVALLRHRRVPVDIVYRYEGLWAGEVTARLITRNRKEERLGVPLPAGRVAFFQAARGRRVLVGRASLDDKAVGEEVEIDIGPSTDVQAYVEKEGVERPEGEDAVVRSYRLTVTNAKSRPVPFEAWVADLPENVLASSAGLTALYGSVYWVVKVPANGRATLTYTARERR